MAFEFSDVDRLITIHHFDDNRVYIGTDVDVMIRAGEGLPGYSTDVDLPVIGENQTAQLNESETAWAVVDDYRGQTAYAKDVATHEDYEVEDVGPIPDTHTMTVRPNDLMIWDEVNDEFVMDPNKVSADLVAVKNAKVAEFRELCGDRIMTGFVSDALGTDGAYRCNRDDQNKMRVAKESTTGGKIWLGEVFTQHTQAQAQVVYDAAIAHVDNITTQYSDKYAEIQAATTAAEVQAITWPE